MRTSSHEAKPCRGCVCISVVVTSNNPKQGCDDVDDDDDQRVNEQQNGSLTCRQIIRMNDQSPKFDLMVATQNRMSGSKVDRVLPLS
ncbi:hypothetical protein C0J52_00052 [Blattella germanica]|nr:hypothetical protein C0J52_00052 [Blattella germanica]